MILARALIELAPGAQWSINDETYDSIEWLTPEIAKPTLEEVTAKIAEIETLLPMEWLREKRNELLAESDWMASADRTMTEQETAYRQALRDLPANTADPANPVWPTKP